MVRSISGWRAWRQRGTGLTALLTVIATLVACGDGGGTGPEAGRLVVTITGLPAGVSGAVTITGPDGFQFLTGSSRELAGLDPGSYTITAADVTAGGNVRYTATPATQTVVVTSGALATAAPITYAASTARLAIAVLGLPTGTAASITVTGPGSYTRQVTGSQGIDLLMPGVYTVTSSEVQAAGKTYRPAPATQTLSLTASATPTEATVDYGAGSATLNLTISGLPAGTRGAVSVAGPGGFTRTITASTTLEHLEAGTYTISADTVGSNLTTHAPSASNQTVGIADGGAAAATVAYGSAPLTLHVELVADGFTAPVFLAAPDGDGRQFIVERNGRIRIIKNGALLPTPFLDIRSRVDFTGERGMLSMAFDPQYDVNGTFYVYYVALFGFMIVEQFSSTPGSDVAGASGRTVFAFQHHGENHHGGLIAFGPDGMLYVAPGDGGCCGDPQNNAQNPATLLGKLLRIDVRTTPYVVPPDNPFVNRAGTRPEIWASGLRNPWRFSFDAQSGLLFIGDVGQDTREEINVSSITAAGLNYGWRLMEGTACYNPTSNCNPSGQLTLPAHQYLHSDGCSVTGGYVYRGTAIPELTGHYLYADYCQGWLRSFRATSAGVANEHRSWTDISLPGTVSFGRDGAGELYMIAGTRVWRIVRR
ncbi:MAG TPA: PQQ-dependent sugar dehydrogenase [Gemmatimonadaceae bacterium]|nr:PQQ-dependent sugar dehydrogenase [Gemmatimonadaceae bacterium]